MRRQETTKEFDYDIVNFLIKAGADLSQPDSHQRWSSIFLASRMMLLTWFRTPYQTVWETCFCDPSLVKENPYLAALLENRDPLEEFGFTELHAAVLHLDHVKISIRDQLAFTSRLDVDQQDYAGRTALFWAAKIADIEAMKLLLTKGADPNIPDHSGYTPFLRCANRSDCLTILLEAGADIQWKAHGGYSKMHLLLEDIDDISCVELLSYHGVNLNEREMQGFTPLILAIYHGRIHSTRWLLENNASIEDSNVWGQTALLEALAQRRHKCLKIMLEYGADYRVQDCINEGILHYAARYGDLTTISILRRIESSKLDTSARNICGKSVYDRSATAGMTATELAEWRRDYNAEWAITNQLAPDADPQVWFAAFESFLESVSATDVTERFSDFWMSIEDNPDTLNGEVDESRSRSSRSSPVGMNMAQGEELCGNMPGAFPA